MKLLEKNILSKAESAELLTKSGKDKTDYLRYIARKNFKNDPDYNVYEETLIDSMERYGTDTAQNKFLQYIVTKSGVPFNMKQNQPYLIYKLLDNAESNVVTGAAAQKSWLYNPNSYNGSDFKIKALAFLSSKDAEKYGNLKDRPTQKILNTTDDELIKTMLSNWQTKDGEQEKRHSRSSSSKSSSTSLFNKDSKKVAEDKAQKLELIKNIYSSNTKDVIAAINKVYIPGITDSDLIIGVSKVLGQNALTTK